VSKLTGIPKEELRVEGSFERGPDFHVYHKEGLVAIVEVETTTLSKRYPGGCLDYDKDQLMTYFTKEEWKHLREAKFGISIAIFLKDLDMISTVFEEEIEHTKVDMEDIVWNPNYGS